jgi:crotonobetainyl-CoA:carnitine CoA-transferase CaiB-like acyl-CoA transferase
MQGALEGVRVLEVAEWFAVPSATAILADWGAEIVKVERVKGGDSLRRLKPVIDLPKKELHMWWEQTNRNKKGIAIDLWHEEGREIVYALAQRCDVFATNFITPVLERFRIDYETMSKINPRLVYAQLSGFGKKGPYKNKPGFDHVAFWANSGIMGKLGAPGSPPPLQPRAFGDNLTSGFIAGAISAALYSREKTGKGQCIDFSLYHYGVWGLSLDIMLALVQGKEEPHMERGNGFASNPLTNCYKTKNGIWVQIWCIETDRYWKNFCEALSLDHIKDAPKFTSHKARSKNSSELVSIIEDAILGKTYEELEKCFEEAGEIIFSRVQTPLDIVKDPQAEANAFFPEIDHPTGGKLRLIASPAQFSDTPATIRKAAPALGQDTQEILSDAGYNEHTLLRFREKGIIS